MDAEKGAVRVARRRVVVGVELGHSVTLGVGRGEGFKCGGVGFARRRVFLLSEDAPRFSRAPEAAEVVLVDDRGEAHRPLRHVALETAQRRQKRPARHGPRVQDRQTLKIGADRSELSGRHHAG